MTTLVVTWPHGHERVYISADGQDLLLSGAHLADGELVIVLEQLLVEFRHLGIHDLESLLTEKGLHFPGVRRFAEYVPHRRVPGHVSDENHAHRLPINCRLADFSNRRGSR